MTPTSGSSGSGRWSARSHPVEFLTPTTTRSQVMGGMLWALGQAFLEGRHMDSRLGRWVNTSLGDYFVAVNADYGAERGCWRRSRGAHPRTLQKGVQLEGRSRASRHVGVRRPAGRSRAPRAWASTSADLDGITRGEIARPAGRSALRRWQCGLGAGQPHDDSGPAIRRALGMDVTAVQLHDLPADVQPEAQP